ncbi:unnamed protein product, partial [Urochloa humidicola]
GRIGANPQLLPHTISRSHPKGVKASERGGGGGGGVPCRSPPPMTLSSGDLLASLLPSHVLALGVKLSVLGAR